MTGLAIKDEMGAFSDDQITAAARLFSEGVGENAVALSTGLDTHELAVLRQDPRYKAKASELTSMIQLEDLGLDSSWSTLEAAALAQLEAEMMVSGDSMTPMEKLAIAAKANNAKRRHGVLADSGRGRANGLLEVGAGGTQIINLTMPTVLVERMQRISKTKGVIIEHEQEAQNKFEADDLHSVSLEDVQQIFDVELDEDADQGVSSIDTIFTGMFSESEVNDPDNLSDSDKQKLAAAGFASSPG